MPQVAVALAAAETYALVAEFAAFTLEAGSFGSSVIAAASAVAVSVVGSNLLGLGPGSLGAQERSQVIRQAAAPRRLVFGEVLIGGVLACPPMESTSDDKLANLVIIFGDGEFESFDPVYYVGEKLSDDEIFDGLLDVHFNMGSDDQAALASLIAERADVWTADHRLRGVAHAHVRLKRDDNAFPGGLPQLRFLARGLKLYDPRTETTAWSANPALVALYYLRSPLGLRCPDHLIDFDSFAVAANVCDEVLDSVDPDNVVDAVPGKVRRYTLNGVVDLAAGRGAIVGSIESSCAGRLVFSQGKYRFYAGAYDEPQALVLTGDMLRADPTYRRLPQRNTLFNVVSGTYVEPKQDWQDADYALQQDAAAIAADGDEIVQGLKFPFTTNGATAQRLARLALKRVRHAATLSVQCNWAALSYRLWDVVLVDIPELELALQPFRVLKTTLAEGGGVDLVLQLEDAADYAWSTADEVAVAAVARPGNSSSEPPAAVTGLTVNGSPRLEQYGTVPQLAAEWDASTLSGLSHYEVQWKLSSDPDYSESDTVVAPLWRTGIVTLELDYDVRVRAMTRWGRYSAWAEELATTVLNDTSAPGLPSALSVTGSGLLTIGWTTPADDDFKKCNVYVNTSMTYVGATLLASVVGLQETAYTTTHTPGATRYYYVSSVDRTGNESALTYAGTGT